MIHKFLVILFFVFSVESLAQDRVIDRKFTYWTRAYLQYELMDPVVLNSEMDNRRYFVPHSQFQAVSRITLLARLYSWLTVGSGLDYSLEYSEVTKLSRPEIRPHQEMNLAHSKDNWDFSYRLRLEQRFIQDTMRVVENRQIVESREDSFRFGFRSRYSAGAEYGVIQREKEKGHLSIEGKSEIMFTATLKDWDI